jgi:hypothetical protein
MKRKIIMNTNVDKETESIDGDPFVVRGDLFSGWILEEEKGGTYIEYIVQVDPKGMIPNWYGILFNIVRYFNRSFRDNVLLIVAFEEYWDLLEAEVNLRSRTAAMSYVDL